VHIVENYANRCTRAATSAALTPDVATRYPGYDPV
jgi:hypothetical protein